MKLLFPPSWISKVSLLGALFSAMLTSHLSVAAPVTTETQKYLVIGTGSGTSGSKFEAYDSDSGELGADQEVVSSGSGDLGTQQHDNYTSIGLDLTGSFVETDGKTPFNSNNRWTDADPDHVDGDTVGISEFLPGARPLLEPPETTS